MPRSTFALSVIGPSVVVFLGCSVPLPTQETAPSPVVATPQAPATITMSSTAGFGNTYGQIFLVTVVKDSTGRSIAGTTVSFAATAGTIDPEIAMTDLAGMVQNILRTTTPASVTVTAGAASSRIDVTPILAPPPSPPPPPFVPPPVRDDSPPPSATPPPSLSASFTCKPAAPPAQTVCNATASYGSTAIASPTVTTAWDWGDGTTLVSGTPLGQHAYAQAGTYRVFVTVSATTSDGPKTTTSTQNVIVP